MELFILNIVYRIGTKLKFGTVTEFKTVTQHFILLYTILRFCFLPMRSRYYNVRKNA